MHTEEHLDLIDALVEGHSTDPAAAQRLVDTCPECREAYRAHLAVKQAVEIQPVIPLSDLERRRLRSGIWSELDTSPEPKRMTPSWYRIAPIAAALVLVVGVGSILLNRGGSTTTATTFAAASAPMDAYTSQEESSNRDLSGSGESDAGGATATTISPSQDTAAMAATETTAGASGPPNLSADELAQAAARFLLTARRGDLDPDLYRCLDRDALAPEDPFADESIVVDDQPAWLVAFGSQGDVSAVVVYGVDDCAVYFRDR